MMSLIRRLVVHVCTHLASNLTFGRIDRHCQMSTLWEARRNVYGMLDENPKRATHAGAGLDERINILKTIYVIVEQYMD